MNDQEIDARLVEAFRVDEVGLARDAAVIGARTRKRIAMRSLGRWGVATAIAAALVGGFWFTRTPQVLRDAARDHRREMLEHQPRRWRTDTDPKYSALAPKGFHLLYSRTCGLEGKPALHLVFTDGGREMSIYVRKSSAPGRTATASIGPEHLAVADDSHWEVIAVSTDTGDDCLGMAKHAVSALSGS